ncbi:hypothetical protein [Mucilaginibacter ginsenosidivorans]|uniref:Uncharacterized protein n=1 Tax=Mucilaginibacter ginsenosidivorans TaxID=398053 RepID=A0A5B8V1F9_9SPHI|nr:hypothetical protein [Mucilaginibacter ginsenosidivorans]QEC64396.1 hypothetical protein FRZ54_18035 [Mucilaginibacter ginsenosidivorans]
MKKITVLFLALITGAAVSAQQKSRVTHMTVTIVDDHAALRVGRRPNNMFITRDDTAQVQRVIDLDMHVRARDEPAAYEKMMMNILKPYYDNNWKLVTADVEFVASSNTEIFRYYFIKEE